MAGYKWHPLVRSGNQAAKLDCSSLFARNSYKAWSSWAEGGCMMFDVYGCNGCRWLYALYVLYSVTDEP